MGGQRRISVQLQHIVVVDDGAGPPVIFRVELGDAKTAAHLLRLHVLEEDDGMVARGLHEELVEVGRGRCQHHLVTLYGTTVTGQGDVTEGLQE